MYVRSAQTAMKFNPGHNYSRENFFVSESNYAAHSFVTSWPDWPSHCMIIYGPESCGKTHLANIWAETSDAVFFNKNQDVSEIAGNRNMVIENIDKDISEIELLNCFNIIRENDGYLMLTSRFSPNEYRFGLADLISRLNSALSVQIKEPDERLLKIYMMKHFSDRQIKVNEQVVEFLASRVERSFGAINYIIGKLDNLSLAEKKNITVTFARKIIDHAW